MAMLNLYFFEYTLKQFEMCSLLQALDHKSSIQTSESFLISLQKLA